MPICPTSGQGIEPLTPRLPVGKGRKTQSLSYRLVSRFLPVIQGVFRFTMIAPVTMTMPVWIRFSTFLAQHLVR